MRQTLITLLFVITLLSQWGWLEHGYHNHDASEVCELCVSASGHVAVTPSILQLSTIQGSHFSPPAITPSLTATAPRFYATRAPPTFL